MLNIYICVKNTQINLQDKIIIPTFVCVNITQIKLIDSINIKKLKIMGTGHYSSRTYNAVTSARSYATKSANQIFSDSLKDSMNPALLKNGIRECRDSTDHPYSVPIMVFVDVTGSMGSIPYHLIQNKFPKMMDTLVGYGVSDAQICFGAIGDHISDYVPLQIGQFEQETVKLVDGLADIYIEGGGGGQTMESYPLAWYIAGFHTSTDSFEKRGLKGFLFTIGDESFHPNYNGKFIQQMMGMKETPQTYTAQQLYASASEKYHVFHIHVNDGSYTSNVVGKDWKKLLGERFLILDNSNDVAELIGTTVSVINGADINSILKSFDSSTASNISKTLGKVEYMDPSKYYGKF